MLALPESTNCQGFSLVELMVALALGSVLTLAVATLFLRSKISYLQDEQMARLQENGRYALRYLTRELEMSGYLDGALSGRRVEGGPPGVGCFNHMLDIAVPLEHYDNTDIHGVPQLRIAALPAGCVPARSLVAGADVLLTRRVVASPAIAQSVTLTPLDPNAIFMQRRVVAGSYSLVTGRAAAAAAAAAIDSAWHYAPSLLFLRRYSVTAGDDIPTLCRRRISLTAHRMAPTECFVEGVQDMQLEFALDDDGDNLIDRMVSAPTAVELQRAVAVRLHLLLRSVNPVNGYTNRHSYSLGGKVVLAANDAFYRRVVRTTVPLRNALARRL